MGRFHYIKLPEAIDPLYHIKEVRPCAVVSSSIVLASKEVPTRDLEVEV